MVRRMNFLNLVQLLAKIRGLLAIDLSAEGLRKWLGSLVNLADYLTDMTGLEWDDDLAALLRAAVDSDEVYAAFYAVVERVLTEMDDEQTGPDNVTPIPIGELGGRITRFASMAYNETGDARTVLTSPAVTCKVPAAEASGSLPWVTLISIVVRLVLYIVNCRK